MTARTMAKSPAKTRTTEEMHEIINGITPEVMNILCQPSASGNSNAKLVKQLDQARFLDDGINLDLGFNLDELINRPLSKPHLFTS